MKQLPTEADCARYSELLDDAAAIGFRLIDAKDLTLPGSHLHALRQSIDADPATQWTLDTAQFVQESVRALVGIVSVQLRGISALLQAGPIVHLHPLAALTRSVAEACGMVYWQFEPWIDNSTKSSGALSPTAFAQISDAVLSRADLIEATELWNRRRRLGATFGDSSPEWQAADAILGQKKQDILNRSPSSELSGRSSTWQVDGEKSEQLTDLVHHALELAHGQHIHGHLDERIYNMLSGYSHPSIETFYAHNSGNEAPSTTLFCNPTELQWLVGTAGRMFAVHSTSRPLPQGTTSRAL